MGNRLGRTEPSTQATGDLTKRTERARSGTSRATSTRDIGRTIRLMATESTPIQMEQSIRVTGKTISNTAGASKSGRMALSMKAFISKGVNTVRGVTCGQTVQGMWETGRRIKSTDRASTSGWTVVATKAIGKATIWTVTASTPGKTAESTKVSTCETASTDSEFTRGPMGAGTKDNGKTVDSTAKGFTG